MAGSTIGTIFKVMTWGESHGAALGAVIDGCPAGLSLTEEDIQTYLDRRKPGQNSLSTPRKESDCVEILSGVFEGKTTGTPISLMIRNTSQKSSDYAEIAPITGRDTLTIPLMPNMVSVIIEVVDVPPDGKLQDVWQQGLLQPKYYHTLGFRSVPIQSPLVLFPLIMINSTPN